MEGAFKEDFNQGNDFLVKFLIKEEECVGEES